MSDDDKDWRAEHIKADIESLRAGNHDGTWYSNALLADDDLSPVSLDACEGEVNDDDDPDAPHSFGWFPLTLAMSAQ